MSPNILSRFTAGALLLVFGNAHAAPPPVPNTSNGTVQYAFTPDGRADDMIVEAIAGARKQVLVQAFSFTHRRIAEALIKAHSRGVEVVVIADYEQTYQIETSVIGDIADGGVPVLLDAQHASAHNDHGDRRRQRGMRGDHRQLQLHSCRAVSQCRERGNPEGQPGAVRRVPQELEPSPNALAALSAIARGLHAG
jgi:hypothetical protein